MFDTLNERRRLSDLTNYISNGPNASNLSERVASKTDSKNKGKFEISEENIIRSIPGYDSVIVKRKDKAVRLF